ncbi:acyl-CoA reductase-like NAD-dependent aldehyde dehydrogenase [Streptomyces puniciscabiei]|uniref:Acyl-CoA reductase-like NAD-dependent aldehyde dehydrogenase n=1 Tax=Streptomyces puniciscabiei TaxID=164348 RepID=A0A542UH23_9ACTN|nr:aldehyde dehydrogenase [Streptomyces puniciscabiei]TQK98351.1 acyl-CoA reductase-like NAD-dependent aldehyde dehydrogenase [Streptomyces puniciscabiei]
MVDATPGSPRARTTPLLSYSSYIGDKDVEGNGWVYTVSSRSLLEDVFTSLKLKRALEKDPDPASPAAQHPYVVGRCAVVADADIDSASDAAAAAFPEWAAVPLADRLELGRLVRERLLEHWDRLLDLLAAEAHPRKLARWELTGLLTLFGDTNRAFYAQQMHQEFQHGDRRLIVRRQPDGVVCVNPPQNAPAAMAALSVLVLMAGNTVVVRAPRSIALSTMYILRELVAPALAELGAPAGTLNLICGKPRQIIDRWLAHPKVSDVFYFGDSEQGMRFERECVAHGKKPVLELAGNDTVVVWKDADLDRAAEAITEAFYGSGQICMVPNCVVAHPAVADALLDRVARLAADITPGLPEDEDVLLSPVRRSERFFALLREATDAGARIVCGGRRIELDGTPSEAGVFLEPTVVRVDGPGDPRDLDIVRLETFFPLIPVVVPEPAADDLLLERMIDFVNSNAYGLRNSLWSSGPEVIDHVVRTVRNGGLLKINDSHIGTVPYLPTHGGTGLTSGVFGEANYPMLKTSRLQGVSVAHDVSPRAAVFES